VKLSSFGSFMVREKGGRLGRNPKTGTKTISFTGCRFDLAQFRRCEGVAGAFARWLHLQHNMGTKKMHDGRAAMTVPSRMNLT
jgi:hypothetical protein